MPVISSTSTIELLRSSAVVLTDDIEDVSASLSEWNELSIVRVSLMWVLVLHSAETLPVLSSSSDLESSTRGTEISLSTNSAMTVKMIRQAAQMILMSFVVLFMPERTSLSSAVRTAIYCSFAPI